MRIALAADHAGDALKQHLVEVFIGPADDLVTTYLAARYTHEARHVRRLGKVKALERRWSKEQP
jgi:ribose 5-phosphate isomerase RpiB